MFSNEPQRRATQVHNIEFNFSGFTVPFKSMQTLKFISFTLKGMLPQGTGEIQLRGTTLSWKGSIWKRLCGFLVKLRRAASAWCCERGERGSFRDPSLDKELQGRWSPLNSPRSIEPWTEILPKTCITLHLFEQTEARKLQAMTRKHLMKVHFTESYLEWCS